MSNERTAIIKSKRLAVPCFFDEGMKYSEFAAIVDKVARRFKRIVNVEHSGTTIECTVVSQTGSTKWKFKVNFNNWGHVDGTGWVLNSENPDSDIPFAFRDEVSLEVVKLLDRRGCYVPDMNEYVCGNEDLGTPSCMGYRRRLGLLDRIVSRPREICFEKSSQDLSGEHFYPVISILKTAGFQNISSKSIDDVDGNSPHYPFEVECVFADGVPVDGVRPILDTAEILITYHAGRLVRPQKGSAELRGSVHTIAESSLVKQGFSDVRLVADRSLLLDVMKKRGLVSKVTVRVGSSDEDLLRSKKAYPYDAQIKVHYHEFRY